MSKVHDNPHGLDDYSLELTAAELDALREVVRDADGRKSEVKLSRDVLGVRQ